MLVTAINAEDVIRAVLAAPRLIDALATLDAPVYVTDPDGLITWHNAACVDFAGRKPELGSDRWCVTWKLRTIEGEHLPHDLCPMAVAIRERRPVRGVTAIAERPDGTEARFMPFPTPLFDADGNFAGAVNLFVDLSRGDRAAFLRDQATRCRRLAGTLTVDDTADTLRRMADDYDSEAGGIERPH